MKESVIFEQKIANVLRNNLNNTSDECLYLLLSIDDKYVYWLMKAQSGIINEEFLNFLKFTLPYGVKIIGVLNLGKIDDQKFKSISEDFYTKIRKLAEDNQIDIISKFFYSIVINKVEEVSDNSCIGYIYSISESENDKIILVEFFNKIKYVNLDKVVKSEYFIVNLLLNPLSIKSLHDIQINRLYSSNIGLIFRDLNITIPNLSLYYNASEDSSDKLLEEMTELNSKHRSRLERFINHKDRDDIVTECYFLMDTSLNEEVSSNSIHDKKDNQFSLNSIKISVTCLFSRNQNLTILDISYKILDRYYFLMKELNEINKAKINPFSLYLFYDPSCLPIPLGILFSESNKNDESEENSLAQRAYYHKIFNLCYDKPYIRKAQVKYKLEDYFKNQLSLENKNNNKSFFNLYKSIHINRIKSIEGAYIKGDYYYYHTALGEKGTKGEFDLVNYRALQTYLSWFNLNGYINIEIPSIEEINKLLIYLGQISSSKFINKINIENIACILSYLVDIKIDIISINNKKEFELFSRDLHQNIISEGIPVLISANSIGTLVGVSKDFTNYLIVNHEYNRSKILASEIFRSNACQWRNIDEVFSVDCKIEILMARPMQAI